MSEYPRGRKRAEFSPTLGTNNRDWMTPRNLAYLRELWGQVSASNIAHVVGTTKGSIISKARRIGLPKLPNPCRRSPESYHRAMPLAANSPVVAPRPVIVAPPARVAPAPVTRGVVDPCSWPIGTPKTPGFRFCDDSVVPGRPYCPSHCKLAFVERRHDVGGVATREAG